MKGAVCLGFHLVDLQLITRIDFRADRLLILLFLLSFVRRALRPGSSSI